MLLETCKVKSVTSTYVEVRGGKKLVHGHKIWQSWERKQKGKGDEHAVHFFSSTTAPLSSFKTSSLLMSFPAETLD